MLLNFEMCTVHRIAHVAGAGTLRSWLMDTSGLDQLTKEISTAQHHVQQLACLLDSIEHQDDLSVSMIIYLANFAFINNSASEIVQYDRHATDQWISFFYFFFFLLTSINHFIIK